MNLHSYIAFLPIRMTTVFVPRSAALMLARCAGLIASVVMPRSRATIRRNLRMLGMAPSGALIRATFMNYARFLTDLAFLPRYARRNVDRLLRSASGYERLEESLRRGRGCVIVSCHLGNWEVGGALLAARCRDLTALALRFPGGGIVRYREEIRARFGVGTIYLEDADSAPLLYGRLRRGGAVLMLADRNYTTTGVDVRFATAQCSYPAGPALLTRLTGADLFAAFCVMRRDGMYAASIEPLTVPPESTERERAIREMTREIARAFERTILAHPDQWFNFDHGRPAISDRHSAAAGREADPRPPSRR